MPAEHQYVHRAAGKRSCDRQTRRPGADNDGRPARSVARTSRVLVPPSRSFIRHHVYQTTTCSSKVNTSSEYGRLQIVPSTRKYDQRLRAEAAEETRRRILDALAEQLRLAPTEQVSLELLARNARVARSTIYTIFGSRAGMFDAFVDDLWQRTGLADLTVAVGHADARTHLRAGIRAANKMYAKDRGIYRVLFSLGQLDPDSIGGATAKIGREREGGMNHLAQRLHDDGALRDDVSIGQATDILWVLCSFDTFDALYTDRQLPLDTVSDLIASMAERALCQARPPGPPGPTAVGS